MPEIKFSHDYPKLHAQKAARLLCVELRNRSELPEDFIEYDTVFIQEEGTFPGNRTGHYELPSGRLLVLVFLGNNLFPFTTVRRWTKEKERYYRNLVGTVMGIKIATIKT